MGGRGQRSPADGAGFCRLGLKPGERVATFAMNHHRHLAAWYGAIGAGGVIHTVNVRLFDEDLIYIMNHAEDKVLMYDAAFQPIIDRLKPHLTTVEHYIVFDSAQYEASDWRRRTAILNGSWAMSASRACFAIPAARRAIPKACCISTARRCCTRMAEIAPAVFNLSTTAALLPIVPMFHAASWGLPFAGAAAGVKFVFSTTNEAPILHKLMLDEGITHSAGVPTVWLAMFAHLDGEAAAGREAGLGQIEACHHRRHCGSAHDDRTVDETGRPRRPCLGDDRNLAHWHHGFARSGTGTR